MRSYIARIRGIGQAGPIPLIAVALAMAGCASGGRATVRSTRAPDAMPDSGTTSSSAASTTLVPPGLSPEQIGTWKLEPVAAEALLALAAPRGLPPVRIITGRPGPHVESGPDTTVPVPVPLQPAFDRQLASARNAAEHLLTPAAAAKAGYVSAAPFVPGDGVHWIRWDLVGEPFDPARPSMLLFSDTTEHARLIAFSYYTRSVGSPPAGFVGSNDQWHRHRGICITAGRTTGEEVAASGCGGIWLNGADLWMLHAWVVPGETNPWGRFAPIDPTWCLDIPGCGPNPLPGGGKKP